MIKLMLNKYLKQYKAFKEEASTGSTVKDDSGKELSMKDIESRIDNIQTCINEKDPLVYKLIHKEHLTKEQLLSLSYPQLKQFRPDLIPIYYMYKNAKKKADKQELDGTENERYKQMIFHQAYNDFAKSLLDSQTDEGESIAEWIIASDLGIALSNPDSKQRDRWMNQLVRYIDG